MRERRPIAIVGLGGAFPGALSLDQFWQNIVGQVDATREVPPGRWVLPPEDVYDPGGGPDTVISTRGGFIEEFTLDPDGLDVDRALLAALDPLYHLVLHTGRQAYHDGVTHALDPERVGVILAAIALPTDSSSAITREILGRSFEEALRGSRSDGAARNQLTVSPLNSQVTALPAGLLAMALGLGGGTCTLDAACASSLYAIKLACDELQARRADAMLAGGVSRPESLYTQMGFGLLQALSPSGCCRPFDAAADGLVVGEGAGMFLLKRLDDAVQAGDQIYGVIRGIGLANDVAGSLLAADSEGQLRALRAAYEQAGWSPIDVDYLECHGTGTPLGDAVELQSLQDLWREQQWRSGQCRIGSVKSMIGHLLTAAGAAGLIKTLLALRARRLPPSLHFSRPPAGIDLKSSPFWVQTEAEPWERRDAHTPRRAGISAFGFGGINAHLLIEEYDATLAGDPARVAARVQTANTSAELEPVAIVGIAAHFGQTHSLQAFRELVLHGETAIGPRPATRWRGADDVARALLNGHEAPGAYIESLSVPLGEFRLPPKEIPEILPQQLLMLQVAADALADARIGRRAADTRAGVIVGIGLDPNTSNYHLRWVILPNARRWAQELNLALTDAELKQWVAELREQAGPALNATRVLGALGSITASRIAREFGFGGPSFTVSADAASGLRALEIAVRALQQGDVDTMVIGAVDLTGDVRSVLTRHALRPLSRCGRLRPFDADADGTVVGEGAGAVVLRRLSDAQRAGDRVYAIVKGVGSACGGHAGRPGARAYALALQRAYADARVEPGSIDYVEAHGSSDPDEDRAELEVLATHFGRAAARGCALGSVKANIGDPGAAAGLAALAKAALCLHEGVIPPLAGSERAAPDVPWEATVFQLPRSALPWPHDPVNGPRRAGVSAIALDGNCMHVVLEGLQCGAKAGPTDRGRRPKRPSVRVLLGGIAPRPRLPAHVGRGKRAPALTGDSLNFLALSQTPEWVEGLVLVAGATARAHETFLRFSQTANAGMSAVLTLQARTLERLSSAGSASPSRGPAAGGCHTTPTSASPAFTREQCLVFATGSVAKVLGPAFADVDTYAKRVRLPDEPLMLVDRIVSLSGEPRSLSSGTIVTEHNVRPSAWYLDGGRTPLCIAVEAGQADLFLCSYLGIDQAVKGTRVYRLLDARLCFHRDLPRLGETIRYDIAIDRFVRQGETWLFFFRFEATIGGQPLITMTNGCAGFFTPREIEESRGIVLTVDELAPVPRRQPNACLPSVPLDRGSYDERQLDALRAGDLAGCFGPLFADLNLREPLRIPGGRMRLLHRVTELSPAGGRFGLGLIRGEADIHPDDWFLTCHFVDDMVMPGTLMFECCVHTLRVFMLRMGWVGEQADCGFEPVLGRTCTLKCRGPVTPQTKLLAYEVHLKELGFGPEPYAVADALLYADGKRIVRFTDMALRVRGLTRAALEQRFSR